MCCVLFVQLFAVNLAELDMFFKPFNYSLSVFLTEKTAGLNAL